MSEDFPSTCWSRVRLAGGGASPQPEPAGGGAGSDSRAALDELARLYVEPARAYLRAALRLGAADAEDVVQEFFARLVQGFVLPHADPARGRFRAFLKVALKRFAIDERRRSSTRARGGGSPHVSLDVVDEPGLAAPAADEPEAMLDREWRRATIDAALLRLREECERDGRSAVFLVFRDFLIEPAGGGERASHAALAARHGLTITDVSNYLTRARQRFRSHLRRLVQETVSSDDDLRAELRFLFDEPDDRVEDA